MRVAHGYHLILTVTAWGAQQGRGYGWYPPGRHNGGSTHDGYCAGLARGWPFSAIKKTSTLVGAVGEH
jgi:hypothetical protein